jgi:LAS superfamily LD-carboxypeptidase LdcB
MLRQLRDFLQPSAQAIFDIAQADGKNPKVTSVYRSAKLQGILYRRYLNGGPIAAPPGRSKHQFRLAFDLHVSDRSYLEYLGKLWEEAGGTWGGRFKDPVHFDYRGPLP